MIEYIARDGEPEAMTCPAFICDACRRQVTGAGNIYWAVRYAAPGQRQSSPLFVSHKYECSRAVDQIVETTYPFAEGWSGALSNEIRVFLAQLNHNAEHAFADDPDGTYLDHDVVHPGGMVLPTFDPALRPQLTAWKKATEDRP